MHASSPSVLAIQISSPTQASRGALQAHVEQELERQLEHLGAFARPGYVDGTREAILSDQLYRARMLGYLELQLTLATIADIAVEGVLAYSDSETLTFWQETQRSRSEFSLCLDAADSALLAHSPVPLDSAWPALFQSPKPVSLVTAPLSLQQATATGPVLVVAKASAVAEPPKEAALDVSLLGWGELSSSAAVAVTQLDAADEGVGESGDDAASKTSSNEASNAFAARAKAGTQSDAGVEPPPQVPVFLDEPNSEPSEGAVIRTLRPALQVEPVKPAGGSSDEAPLHADASKAHSSSKSGEVRNNVVSFRHAMRGLLRDDEAVPAPSSSEPTDPAKQYEVAFTNEEVSDTPHQLLKTLRDASGGQSYESLETLFAECYLPLRQCLLDGNGPPGCAQALSSFSADFARSYARAFEALRTRGKRPTMVLDAPQIAFRLARQHAAPKHTLLLVDAMRYDVGVAAEERLHLQLLGHASCVARGKLWSALPADTATQLELLARGAEGLRQLSGGVAESQVMSPPNDARRARSMRVGPHHLFKLDVVQHFVNQQDGLLTAQRLAQASADVAVSVGRFIKSQTPGTLVFVFGDHGFNADRSIEPSPELVLVPYQAWLVRAQHDSGAR